jgi:hypothetical protein
MSQKAGGEFGRGQGGVDRQAEEGRLEAELESVSWHGGDSKLRLSSAGAGLNPYDFFKNGVNKSMGSGMMVVVLRSPAISAMVCR